MTKHAVGTALAASLAIVVTLILCTPLSARQATRVAYAPVGQQPVRSPAAWPDYCARHQSDCAVDLNQPLAVAMSPALLKTIESIDASVNAAVQPITDLDHWRVQDRWDLAEDGSGDCEDYALLKRRMLIRAGLPRRALLMTVVRDEHGAGHAVLMVRTDQGDLILDDMRDQVLLWSQTGYIFLKRESQYSSGWVNIGSAQ